MKHWVIMMVALTLTSPAQAGAESCWVRDYTADHLASHPDQVVASMRLWFSRPEQSEYDDLLAGIRVVAAHGGHAKAAGQGGRTFDQGLICFDDITPLTCAVECDGGAFRVTRQTEDMIEITTDYLIVGDFEGQVMEEEGCGGAMDIAEHMGQPVTYRLYRADPAACELD